MRKVISNAEQTDYIRKRLPFRTRTMWSPYSGDIVGGVYEGILDSNGTYHVWHWNTEIATFWADGTVWLNPRDYSVTTIAFKGRIRSAMTPWERQQADARNARDMHAQALEWERQYGRSSAIREFHGNKHWRDKLARFDYALDVAHRYAKAA